MNQSFSEWAYLAWNRQIHIKYHVCVCVCVCVCVLCCVVYYPFILWLEHAKIYAYLKIGTQ